MRLYQFQIPNHPISPCFRNATKTKAAPHHQAVRVVTPEGLKSECVSHALSHNPNARALGRTFNLTIKRLLTQRPQRHMRWYYVYYVQYMGVKTSIESIIYILWYPLSTKIAPKVNMGKRLCASYYFEGIYRFRLSTSLNRIATSEIHNVSKSKIFKAGKLPP